jgi:cytochrome c-type biogenesis protein CcmH/NrfF
MLRGSLNSGFLAQVMRIGVAAGLGCSLWVEGASLAWSQTPDSAQAPSTAAVEPVPADPGQPKSAESPTAPPSKVEQSPATRAPASKLSDVEIERQSESLSRSIMSPFCPGRTISACPSPNAHAWRDDIRKWVREGVSADEIRSRLAARMPEHNLMGGPPKYVMWLLAGVGVLSVVLLVLALRHLSKPRPAAVARKGADSAPPPGDDRDWDAKLKQELDALEQ